MHFERFGQVGLHLRQVAFAAKPDIEKMEAPARVPATASPGCDKFAGVTMETLNMKLLLVHGCRLREPDPIVRNTSCVIFTILYLRFFLRFLHSFGAS